jgi:hypothetical protein
MSSTASMVKVLCALVNRELDRGRRLLASDDHLGHYCNAPHAIVSARPIKQQDNEKLPSLQLHHVTVQWKKKQFEEEETNRN